MRNINNLKYADDTTLMAENKEELKSLLIKVFCIKQNWLKTQHSRNKDDGILSHPFMANRWETMETLTHFIFLGSKITADGDCSHEIKRHWLLWRKVMTTLDRALKSIHAILVTKVCILNSTAFSLIMYGCEGWIIEKAECQELMLLNSGVGKDSWVSLGLQGDPTSPS